MAGEEEGAELLDAVAEHSEQALTIHLKGVRFEGGKLPLSALATLEKLNAMVTAIARDWDVANRDDATRASRYAKVELVLMGEIEDGSAKFNLWFVPAVIATTAASLTSQTALLDSLPKVVPAVVEAVHQGTEIPLAVDAKTVRLVSEVGGQLASEEELVLGPAETGTIDDAVNGMKVTVSRATSTAAVQAQEVTVTRSFFVSGTLRQLENHGDEPGKLTLMTSSGLYPVPDVGVSLMDTATKLLSEDRNVVLAVSGRGEFDGKGRMKKLTHLSSVRDIDRPFSPDARLAELSELSEAELFRTRLELARLSIERAVLETGRAPALFLDEDDHLEARWTIRRTDDTPSLVVNVKFGPAIEV